MFQISNAVKHPSGHITTETHSQKQLRNVKCLRRSARSIRGGQQRACSPHNRPAQTESTGSYTSTGHTTPGLHSCIDTPSWETSGGNKLLHYVRLRVCILKMEREYESFWSMYWYYTRFQCKCLIILYKWGFGSLSWTGRPFKVFNGLRGRLIRKYISLI